MAINMKNKIQVKINGMEYTLISTEPEEYVQKVASMVNRKMNEVTENCPHLSTAMAAVLSAINLADTCLKSDGNSDHLRTQIADYAEELKAVKGELEEKKQELNNVTLQLQKLQIEIAKKDTLISSLRHNPTTRRTYDADVIEKSENDLEE